MDNHDQRPTYTILVVDDTEANIDILAETLADEYDIVAATTGEDALAIAAESPPDLILLDIMMPVMDGYEVCRRLKDNEGTRDIPVIFVTAKTETTDETHGFELGAVDYITKPISPPIVKARVRTHLELQRARRVLEEQNRELIEAARLRDDVDQIMRHDLKGPLTSIIGMPQLIMMDAELKTDHHRALKYIEESGYIMLKMINLSLDLFKMERGMYVLDPQPVDLSRVFTKVMGDQEILTKNKKLSLDMSINGHIAGETDSFLVMADELLAFSLFSNLVRNAVEAAPDNSPIRIALDHGPVMNRVAVSNMGAVPKEIRDRFFEKYVTSGKSGGTGLGTYSARLMTETMNGSIHLESSAKKGTTVTVLLQPAKETNTESQSLGQRLDFLERR